MKKERKDKDFIKAPYFEGGKAALEAYVKKELRYPKEALAAKVEGTVSVRYTVDYKGKVTEASIISPLGHGCDEEALRIVRTLIFKVPNDGKIKSKYSRKLHIHFRLPGSPAVLPTTKKMATTPEGGLMSYQYQVVSKPSKPVSAPAKKASYEISITIPNTKDQ
jgi:TonB family protein